MSPLEYGKAFLLNFIVFAAAIAIYAVYSAAQPGGLSPTILGLLVVASAVLTVARLRTLLPTTVRLGFTNRAAFLQALDVAIRSKDRWTLVAQDESGRQYAARFNVGLYLARARLTVTIGPGEALLAGPPRVVVHVLRVLVPRGAARVIEE